MVDGKPNCVVSVILPTYNSRNFVSMAISSVLQQTEHELELIIVDDCSTDDTVDIIKNCIKNDTRAKLLHMPQNRGPAAARNLGFDVARGYWIALLDSDDTYVPHRLAQLLQLAKSSGADMVSDNLIMRPIGEAPYLLIPERILSHCRNMPRAEFVLGNIGDPKNPRFSYGFMQPLVRRDFLLRHNVRHDERNRFGEDFMFSVACLQAGASWWVTPDALYHYTIRPKSLTEIQSASDLLRISQFEAALLRDPSVACDSAFLNAVRLHKAKIDRSYYYRAFTDSIKQRRLSDAMKLFTDTSRSSRYITEEAVRQAPVIIRKLLRGGYFVRTRHIA